MKMTNSCYKLKYRFLLVFIVLINIFFFFQHQIFALEKPQIQHILLEQPYPLISKEELVNNYANKYLNKTLQLNSLPSYNSSSNHALNATIKDAPSNLLGVYFDGGTRENKNNYLHLTLLEALEEVKKENETETENEGENEGVKGIIEPQKRKQRKDKGFKYSDQKKLKIILKKILKKLLQTVL